jgi:TonB family protein
MIPRATNFFLINAAALALLCAAPPPRAAAQNEMPKAAQTATATQASVSADAEVVRGVHLYDQGDMAGAIALLRPAAEHLKNDADAWYYLGLALNSTGETKDARKAFEKTLKLRPGWAAPRAGLAYTLLLLKKTSDAESEAKRALSLDPKLAVAHYVLGVTYSRSDNYTRAAEEAETALRLEPNFPAAAALDAEVLIEVYASESVRVSGQHPLALSTDEATRRPVLDKRNEELEPVRTRMRVAAERLEALVKSQPDSPSADSWRELAETLRVYGQTRKEGDAPEVFGQSQVTTKALILFKPEPAYTEDAREHKVSGVVRLRVVLAADGRVKGILVVKGLPNGLTEKAVAAARQIKFKPATIDGRPVAQLVVLEYNFSVY